jgi:cytochrome c oxidase subunit 4
MAAEKEEAYHPHIMPVGTYLAVFAALIILLGVTVGVSFLDLGVFSRLVAVTIAAIKAGLIVTYFMHLRYSEGLVKIYAGIGFLWFILMFIILLSDYVARGGVIPQR